MVDRAENKVIEIVRNASGADITGHRPEDLRAIDELLDERLREFLRQGNAGFERAALGIGSYLGEVMVRNLGARWRFPTFAQSLFALVSRDPWKADKYWYVYLNGQEIHVFRAAKEAIERTSSEFSLCEFYRRWATNAGALSEGAERVG